jgi:hypothetical protein
LQLHRVHYIDLRTDYSRGLNVLLKKLGVEQRAAARAKATPAEPYAEGEQQTASDGSAEQPGIMRARSPNTPSEGAFQLRS